MSDQVPRTDDTSTAGARAGAMHDVVDADGATRRWLPLLPAAAILVVTLADLTLSHDFVYGLVIIGPLLAASLNGPRVTAAYAIAALIIIVLSGAYHDVYGATGSRDSQLVRLAMITTMAPLSVLLAHYRIEREQRLIRMVKVAEAAQRAILLPVPDRLGPARVAVHYDSAATDSLIGGDLYGMVLTPFGLRILVGDVRGKGLDAVQMSARVLASFRERANDELDLAALMNRMEHAVGTALQDAEDFVTAVLVQLDPDGRLTVANAGHPPPVLIDTTGRATAIEPRSIRPPLGLGGTAMVETVELTPGDRVLLYTDGLTEARRPRDRTFFPTEEIVRTVAEHEGVAPAIDALSKRVLAWSGGALHDDIALVLVEYVPQEAGHEAEDQSRTSPALTTTTSSSIASPTVSSVISASDRFWKPAR